MEPPESMPNSEVKRSSADGSVGFPHVRVGHRQAPNTKPDSNESGFFTSGGKLFTGCACCALANSKVVQIACLFRCGLEMSFKLATKLRKTCVANKLKKILKKQMLLNILIVRISFQK